MKARNDCEIACDCVKRANVVLHVRLWKEIFARKHTATHKPTSAQPTHMCHDEMLNRAVMGFFSSQIEVKSSKSFCIGIFLYVPFNPLFYVATMRRCFKNSPAKFQSRSTFLQLSSLQRVAATIVAPDSTRQYCMEAIDLYHSLPFANVGEKANVSKVVEYLEKYFCREEK